MNEGSKQPCDSEKPNVPSNTMSISTTFLLCFSLALSVFCWLLVIQVQLENALTFLLISHSTIRTSNHTGVIITGRPFVMLEVCTTSRLWSDSFCICSLGQSCGAKELLWVKMFPRQKNSDKWRWSEQFRRKKERLMLSHFNDLELNQSVRKPLNHSTFKFQHWSSLPAL